MAGWSRRRGGTRGYETNRQGDDGLGHGERAVEGDDAVVVEGQDLSEEGAGDARGPEQQAETKRAQPAIVTGQCVACHGILGMGDGTNPRMAGQSRG